MSATTLRDLLCTNESPLDGQIPIIRNLITTAQNRLATAESEQDELRKKRAALWVKLDALNAEISSVTIEELETNAKAAALDEIIEACKDQIHRHSAVLAAVRRVPLEVLFEIFDWIEPDAFDRTVYHKRHVPTAPWRITHVCRAWREAAQSYPKLWTNICIHGGMVHWAESDHKAPSMSVLYFLDALEAQLQLSSPASLDVQLEMLEESEYMTMLLKPLIERSHRWSRLTITSDGDRTLWYLTGIERRLSRLEYLTIDTGHNLNTSGWPTELTELFFWADNLQTAKLTNFALTSPSPPLSLPWHQLTKLRICSPLTSLLEILSTAHNLVDCTLEVDELNETWAIPPFVVTLPTVQRLTMGPRCSDDCCSWLVLPQLRFLALEGNPVENAHTLVTTSQCRLETLELRNIEIESDVLLSLLKAASFITNLFVDFCFSFTDEQIHFFFREMRGAGLCPNLASLEIGFRPHQHTIRNSEMACGMIESRWNSTTGVRVLQRVQLSPVDNWPRLVWRRLEGMRVAGLDLNGLTVSDRR